jgi:hypothetical protein
MGVDPLSNLKGRRQVFTPARYESIGADRLSIEVTTVAPGLLVVADTWMPGWSATLDGSPVKIYRGNLAQRVVPIVTPGVHRLEMRYKAPGLFLGGITSAATLAVAFAMLAINRRPHKELCIVDTNQNPSLLPATRTSP